MNINNRGEIDRIKSAEIILLPGNSNEEGAIGWLRANGFDVPDFPGRIADLYRGEKSVNKPPVNMVGYIGSLLTIKARYQALEAGETLKSYTGELLADQNERIKKLGSEVNELIREDTRSDFDIDRFVGEASDTIYAVEVMVAARGLSFLRVLDKMRVDLETGGWLTPEMDKELADNWADRYQSIGAYQARLVDEECRPDFEEARFIDVAAKVVYMTAVILAGRGLTMRPVFDELAARNRSAINADSCFEG